MKKNLKKAISAVIALALSLSLIPASFAAKLVLTDVADTASYATAVNTLVALDIINGYEDNTFKPDDLITRAEVTKVVIAALNKTDIAEGMTGSTKFVDVDESSAWAYGYINAGVQEGFINGMENNTFAPKANVTYAQIVKMLVASMGYEDYAQYMGGWPNGYLAIANSEGITEGVKKGANESVTRAEVAQLVYNALNTPIVKNTGMEYSNTGILVPTIAKMDGTGNNKFMTILTENFDAYVVEGKVTETAKTANSALENDQIYFTIEKTEKYDNDEFNSTGLIGSAIYVGDTDAANFPGTYAQAIIMVDEYDDLYLKSFVPSGKNKSVVFDASLIDDDAVLSNNVFTGTDLYVFASESATKSTKYKLNTDANSALDIDLYVNGYAVTADAANITKYVVNNSGEVEMVDTYKTDGKYDAIYVDYYATAQVSSVTTANKIYFDSCTEPKASITLDVEQNEDLVYNIYLGDEEIEVAALQEDDVLSIAWNVTGAIDASNEYVIYVSRDVQTGKLTSRNDEDKEVTVAGEVYSFVGAYPTNVQMPLADEYKLFLDAFGNIYKYETNTLAAKYAVIDKLVWSTSEEAYKATIITTEGAAKVYVIDDSKVVGAQKPITSVENLMKAVYTAPTNAGAYWVGNNTAKKHVKDRVIEYKVSTTSGEITALEFLPVKTSYAENNKYAYNENNTSIGTVKMSDATKIYDAIEYLADNYDKYNKLTIATLDAFVDDTKYAAYAYGDKLSDGTYPIVIVTAGESAYNAATRFAVVDGAINTSVDEETDEEIYTLPVLYKGEKVTLNISAEATVDGSAVSGATFAKGDVIVFLNDSNGYVEQIDTVMKKATYAELVATVTTTNAANTVAANDLILVNDVANGGNNKGYSADFSDDFTNDLTSNDADAIKFILGPVIEKADKYFTIAKTDANAKTNMITDVIEVSIDGDSTVYTYDFNKTDKLALELSAPAGIVKTNFISKYIVNDVIDWNLTDNTLAGTDKKPNDDQVNFALTLVVGGDAVDTLVYLAK